MKETNSGLLDCKVSSKPASIITWRRLDNTVDIREGLVKGENSLSLHFTDVAREDAGRYRCSANNNIGHVINTDANLVITCKYLVTLIGD